MGTSAPAFGDQILEGEAAQADTSASSAERSQHICRTRALRARRDQSGDRVPVPRNDDDLAPLDLFEEVCQVRLRLVRANLSHAYRLVQDQSKCKNTVE